MRRLLALAAAAASLGLSAAAALATHGTATNVDAIDGSGAGSFAGNLNNTTGDSADWYTFHGTAGTSVTITMDSSAFDSFIFLYRAPGIPSAGDARSTYTQIAADDDSGVGLNSQIVLTLPATGYYIVAAESISDPSDTLGAYTLGITGNVRAIGLRHCKKGGWKALTDASGRGFKNQGDCVSYFDTNGANPAAG
jgi:Bacterial pre-peptidase C-terminal domain